MGLGTVPAGGRELGQESFHWKQEQRTKESWGQSDKEHVGAGVGWSGARFQHRGESRQRPKARKTVRQLQGRGRKGTARRPLCAA